MSNRKIEAILRLSAKMGNARAFKVLGQHMDRIDQRAKQLNRRQQLLARTSKSTFAAMARYAAPAALAYGTTKAYTGFAAIERQMSRIGLTAEASVEETEAAFARLVQSAKDFAMPLEHGVAGLDALVAGGYDLEQAMAFLPSVMATAQAAGADIADIGNTALATSLQLGISAKDMQLAFDIMVAGGKAGKFELKDMARYIPDLAGMFSNLGYSGTDGLEKLVALMQTMRERTGGASDAATQLRNVLIKMNSAETEKRFKEFGIDITAAMDEARAKGEDVLDVFVRLSKEAIKGDLSKLPKLFRDQEFLLGMTTLINGGESMERFTKAVNNVDGSTMKDLGRILADNQATIDKMATSWDQFVLSFGSSISKPVSSMLDYATEEMNYGTAIQRAIDARDMSFSEQLNVRFLYTTKEKNALAEQGGWVDPDNPIGPMQGPAYPGPEFPGNQSKFERLNGQAVTVPTPRPRYVPPLPVNGPVMAAALAQGKAVSRKSETENLSGSSETGISLRPEQTNPDLSALIERLETEGEKAGRSMGDAASEQIKTDAAENGRIFGMSAAKAINANTKVFGLSRPANANVGKSGGDIAD